MTVWDGFLLGISNGGVCLAYCTPVLVPWLLGEGRTLRGSAVSVGGFLGGRFVGYSAFAVLAWLTHITLVERLPHQRAIAGAVTVALAVLLIVYGFAGKAETCRAPSAGAVLKKLGLRSRWLVPVLLGLLTGLSLCPPFLLAFGSAAQLPRLWQSLLFFTAFFLGTSVYVVPLPLIGTLGRREVIRTIGRFAAGVVGLFYLYAGLVNVAAGMR
jgi:sulfite exporter TauE/SafE